MGTFEKDFSVNYGIKKSGNGVFAMVVKGDFTVNGQAMHARDGFGIWNVEEVSIKADSADAEILLMDVPMDI